MIYTKLIPIENNVDYTPGQGEIAAGMRPIVAIHLTDTLADSVTIYFLADPTVGVVFPKAAFVVGGIYSYGIAKIVYTAPADDKLFIGCIDKYVPNV